MNENRRQILEMLAAGKITADEAERLIAALESGPATTVGVHASPLAGGGATVTVYDDRMVDYFQYAVAEEPDIQAACSDTPQAS